MVQGESRPVASGACIDVEVLVGFAPRVVRRVLMQIPQGGTVRDALRASGLLGSQPGFHEEALAAGDWAIGVWGRKAGLGDVLRQRDRVEVVRGLNVDPKEARRIRYRSQGGKTPQGSRRPNKRAPP